MNDLESRLIRYADLRPCRNAFVDTRSPGSESKENFTLIGPGVAENPEQFVHISEPHGFNIGAARQPGRCLNSQHSHDTAEVFVVHTGRWRFMWGANADEGSVELGPGDTISLPIHMFRGFENLGTPSELGFLFAVLGGDDPGHVTWAPRVFDLAKQFGMVLLEGGRLVDTRAGQAVPTDAVVQGPPDARTLAGIKSPTAAEMAGCVARAGDLRANPRSPLASAGVEECPIIVPRATRDGFEPGPIVGWWPHGFNVRCLRLQPGARVPAHVRREPEVLFVQRGALEISTPTGAVALGAGDTFTTPRGLARAFRATSSDGCLAYVVRGGEDVAPVEFVARAEALAS